ncbi:MAG TPA: AAA family ATPase [Microlunatus sp.]|nr:AAA family ATPase [Microlunatus sp.]
MSLALYRKYRQLRTDPQAPARAPQVPTRTPVLAHDGGDLAAALATIEEVGDAALLRSTIADAFGGSELCFGDGSELRLRQPGMLRPLGVAELSDGTLRYLLLVAALLSPRPPELLVLNEPEASLHPELYGSLAGLVAAASAATQLIVVSHSPELVRRIEQARPEDYVRIELIKELGETLVAGQGRLDRPSWRWPDR